MSAKELLGLIFVLFILVLYFFAGPINKQLDKFFEFKELRKSKK